MKYYQIKPVMLLFNDLRYKLIEKYKCFGVTWWSNDLGCYFETIKEAEDMMTKLEAASNLTYTTPLERKPDER